MITAANEQTDGQAISGRKATGGVLVAGIVFTVAGFVLLAGAAYVDLSYKSNYIYEVAAIDMWSGPPTNWAQYLAWPGVVCLVAGTTGLSVAAFLLALRPRSAVLATASEGAFDPAGTARARSAIMLVVGTVCSYAGLVLLVGATYLDLDHSINRIWMWQEEPINVAPYLAWPGSVFLLAGAVGVSFAAHRLATR